MAQVSWPLGAAARAIPGAPATIPRAVSAMTSRRVRSVRLDPPSCVPPHEPIAPPPYRGLLGELCGKARPPFLKCLHVSKEVLRKAGSRHQSYAPLIVM